MNHFSQTDSSKFAPELAVARSASWRQLFELTKPRLSMLSVITALVGYFVAGTMQGASALIALLLGTMMAAGGAGALNMYLEREWDSRMARTRSRPLPAGTLAPGVALGFGLALSLAGTLLLWWGTTPLAAVLAGVTIASYLCVYTPMKRWSRWNTIIGSIPGAIPPLIGAAAATGTLDALAWILFAILFAWQVPHFMAIAWLYRADYAGAGYRMSTTVDPTGREAGWLSTGFCVVLLLASLFPPLFHAGTWFAYGVVALAGGIWLCRRSLAFQGARERKQKAARSLFLASIIYLPAVLSALVLDCWLLG